MSRFPSIDTARLRLRPIEVSDAEALHAALSDPVTMHWWSSGPRASLVETEDYVRGNVENSAWRCWAITERSDDRALGWVNLSERRAAVFEIGYILVPQARGRGIAAEAVSGVIDRTFEDGARRIFADADPENAGSIGLLERLGFRLEGHLREEWETHIGVRDTLLYGLLRREWRERSPL